MNIKQWSHWLLTITSLFGQNNYCKITVSHHKTEHPPQQQMESFNRFSKKKKKTIPFFSFLKEKVQQHSFYSMFKALDTALRKWNYISTTTQDSVQSTFLNLFRPTSTASPLKITWEVNKNNEHLRLNFNTDLTTPALA